VVSESSAVLRLNSTNEKALYRRALGYDGLRKYDEAENDLRKLEEEMLRSDSPKDPAVCRLIVKVRKELKKEEDTQKKQFRNMFCGKEAGKGNDKVRREKMGSEEGDAGTSSFSSGSSCSPLVPFFPVWKIGIAHRLRENGLTGLAGDVETFLSRPGVVTQGNVGDLTATSVLVGDGMVLVNKLRDAGASEEEAELRKIVIQLIQGGMRA